MDPLTWPHCNIILVIYFRFYSTGEGTGKGFEIQYMSIKKFTECGEKYSNTSGILLSPSHPNQYPYNAECIYLISQPKDTYVAILFLSMDVVCGSDYIELRDGLSEDSPLMGIFCGNKSKVPEMIQTTQNFLWVR